MKINSQKMEQTLTELAVRVAHDIGSPLCVMYIVIDRLKQNNIDYANDDIALLESAMQNIKDIAGNLLNQYRDLSESQSTESRTCADANLPDIVHDNRNIPRHIILSTLIAQIVENKRIEWSKKPCNISFEIDEYCRNSFAYIVPLHLTRTISNLLNNAYDSLNSINAENESDNSRRNIIIPESSLFYA